MREKRGGRESEREEWREGRRRKERWEKGEDFLKRDCYYISKMN